MVYTGIYMKGFTLIELLIVIAIIGIISGIVISNISGSVDDAQATADKLEGAHFSVREEKCTLFGKLYMIGSGSDSLYELDTKASGRSPATIVGASFGGQEGSPVSITSHNGKLYMIGESSDSLYELNTKATPTEDPATKIGTGFGFRGSNQEGFPTSITSHNGKLYMIGSGSDSLYVLDTEATGKSPATIVGTNFRNQEDNPRSITSHKGKLYMIGDDSGFLYELDTEATGDPATRTGTSFGAKESDPRSLSSHNGLLYMVGSSSTLLYDLNASEFERPNFVIGTSFSAQESSPQSIISHSGKLYMIGDLGDSLYILDTEATDRSPAIRIGTRFGVLGSNQEGNPLSIASHCGP